MLMVVGYVHAIACFLKVGDDSQFYLKHVDDIPPVAPVSTKTSSSRSSMGVRDAETKQGGKEYIDSLTLFRTIWSVA